MPIIKSKVLLYVRKAAQNLPAFFILRTRVFYGLYGWSGFLTGLINSVGSRQGLIGVRV